MSALETYAGVGVFYFAGLFGFVLTVFFAHKAIETTRRRRWGPVLASTARGLHWFFEPVYPILFCVVFLVVVFGFCALLGWGAERLGLWPY